MTPVQKKIAVVGGAAAAVGLIIFLWPKKAVAGVLSGGGSGGGGAVVTAPPATDGDIDAVATKALAVETDPATLRLLARYMMVIPVWNPLHNKIGLLQQRADTIEANVTTAVSTGGGGETFAHIKQF